MLKRSPCCWILSAWLAGALQLPERLQKISFPARDLLQGSTPGLVLGSALGLAIHAGVVAVLAVLSFPMHRSWRAQAVFPVGCGSLSLVSLLPTMKPSAAIPRGSPSYFCCVSSKGTTVLRLLILKIHIFQIK